MCPGRSAEQRSEASSPSPLPLPFLFLLSIAVFASFTIHGDMSDEKFQDAEALKEWLIGKKVPELYAEAAAPTLYSAEFYYPSALIDITSADLKDSGLKAAIAQSLSNKLKQQQQQQNGK